jgi:hypothetical protein
MLKQLSAAMFVFAAMPGSASAQEEPPSARYIGCRAAEDVDRRLHEICEIVDDIHQRLRAARGRPRRQGELEYAHAMALLVIGDTGDELAMRDCVEASRRSAEYYTRRRTPTRWAVLQLNIGQALTFLGGRGDETALSEAVSTIEAAIEAIRRDHQPELWASAHETLANTHVVRANGRDRQALRQAAAALQAALEIYRRPAFAERRARAEQRLAEIYRALGEDQDAT